LILTRIRHPKSAVYQPTHTQNSIIAHAERAKLQRVDLKLPLFPTTTIGSFPQTAEIRNMRRQYKSGKVTDLKYKKAMQEEIKK